MEQIQLFYTSVMSPITPETESLINFGIDAASLLLLIRLSKIIGNDRDRIIAYKVMKVCKEFPVLIENENYVNLYFKLLRQ